MITRCPYRSKPTGRELRKLEEIASADWHPDPDIRAIIGCLELHRLARVELVLGTCLGEFQVLSERLATLQDRINPNPSIEASYTQVRIFCRSQAARRMLLGNERIGVDAAIGWYRSQGVFQDMPPPELGAPEVKVTGHRRRAYYTAVTDALSLTARDVAHILNKARDRSTVIFLGDDSGIVSPHSPFLLEAVTGRQAVSSRTGQCDLQIEAQEIACQRQPRASARYREEVRDPVSMAGSHYQLATPSWQDAKLVSLAMARADNPVVTETEIPDGTTVWLPRGDPVQGLTRGDLAEYRGRTKDGRHRIKSGDRNKYPAEVRLAGCLPWSIARDRDWPWLALVNPTSWREIYEAALRARSGLRVIWWPGDKSHDCFAAA